VAAVSIAARRYAAALYEVATETRLAERCLADLREFLRELNRTVALKDALSSPAIPAEAAIRVVKAVAAAMQLQAPTVALLGLLASRRRLAQLGDVVEAYAGIQDERAGRARGELVTAGPVSPEQVLRIRDAVGRALGRRLVLDSRLDPASLGGFKVVVGNRVFDLTTRSYLESLRSRLLSDR
jgi:F-type H+-transporting ATPase subunit delta